MAEDIELDYEYLTQRALRRVAFDALTLTAELGRPPGQHHFFIEFLTGAPGVETPPEIRASYPERMMIVLQHQFERLEVDDSGFSVTLFFKGRPSRLTIPFEAVTSFADPSAKFGLRFEREEAGAFPAETPAEPAPAPLPPQGADVVSLDKFRKK